MAANLVKAGFSVVVHNRSRAPVDALVALGATAAGSAADVASRAPRIVTMLPDSPDVERVLEGAEGVFERLQPGTILIDTSSIAPATARRLASAAAERGATMLDAPVSGGEIGAINGTLSIMVGGDEQAFNTVKPIFDAMGKAARIGASGAGQVCKLCNQMVIGGTVAAVGEALALARKAGVDPARVRDALLGGFAASRVLEVHGGRMLSGNFEPGFRTELFAKDLNNVSLALSENHVPAPVFAIVQQLVDALVVQGRGKNDCAELGQLIAELAGLK